METLQLLALVIAVAALLAYLNIRFLKLPATIGLMVLSLILSVAILFAGHFLPIKEHVRTAIEQLNFSEFLLNFMLGFLLFAGGLHTDVAKLKQLRGPIITYATVGTLLSTFFMGSALYLLLSVFNLAVPYIHCLLFGALISPTDPIAVLSILKKAGIAEDVETKITGESLFNDGIGVVLFIAFFNIASNGMESASASKIGMLLLKEVVGGIVFGLVLGYLAYRMMKKIDHYQTEVLLTLAVVLGGTTLAPVIHVSAPLAMVVAGLFIGNKGVQEVMSQQTAEYVYMFWEMVDEIMNALLFVLIGLVLLVIPFRIEYMFIGVIAIVILLIARFFSLIIPSWVFRFRQNFPRSTFYIMTWGGLRGGISIALALSLSVEMHKYLFVSITYIIVLFSILVQGLTLERLVKKIG